MTKIKILIAKYNVTRTHLIIDLIVINLFTPSHKEINLISHSNYHAPIKPKFVTLSKLNTMPHHRSLKGLVEQELKGSNLNNTLKICHIIETQYHVLPPKSLRFGGTEDQEFKNCLPSLAIICDLPLYVVSSKFILVRNAPIQSDGSSIFVSSL